MAAGTGPYWGVVIPRGGVNVVTNPSFETGTVGWAGTSTVGVTLGTVSERQAFGAWSLQASGGGVLGATTTASLGSGSAYTASAYVRLLGGAGSVQISLGGTSNRVPITGTGWRRISVGTVTPSAASYTLAIQRYDAADALYIDGVQLEAGSITTYLDGDQDGCIWEGVAHASRSIRSGDQRTGGSVTTLAAIGLTPEETPGIGAAPTVNQLQPYAVSDGAEYQRTRYEARPFTLNTTFTGTTYEDLHITRRRVFDAIKAGRTPTPAPARLLYWGGGGTVTIDALYAEGMDGAYNNVVAEQAAVRFVAPDPMWQDELDQGTALAAYTAMGSVNFLAYRDPGGVWGTFSGALRADSVSPAIYTIEPAPTGTIFVGGIIGSVNTSRAQGIARIDAGVLGTLAGGTLVGITAANGGKPYAIRYVPWGTLFVGGDIQAVNGTTARGIARWNNAWGTLSGGGLNINVEIHDVEVNNDGRLLVAGGITDAAGTTARGVVSWNGAWGTLNGGTINGNVYSVARFGGAAIAVGGQQRNAGAGSAPGIAIYNTATEAWGSTGGGQIGTAVALTVAPSQELYAVAAALTGAGAGTAFRVRAGAAEILGSIDVDAVPNVAERTDMVALTDGRVLASPVRSIFPGYVAPFGYAIWNGYSWLPPDLKFVTGNGTAVYALAQDAAGTLYVGGGFNGSAIRASIATIVNRGMGDSYPVLRLYNRGAGTARVYQLLNITTGDELYFDYIMATQEFAALDLRPENLNFTSNVRGTIVSAILGGSNLSTWRLAPGTNAVSFFADSADVRADLFWRPRHVSADGAAEPTL
jgi:hypothetical protein